MPTFKSTYKTAFDASATSLHTRASLLPVHSKLKRGRFSYTFVGGEVTADVIKLGSLMMLGARVSEFRIRTPIHLTALLNAAGQFAKITNTKQPQVAGTWARSAAVATVTTTVPHNLVTGQTLVAVDYSSDTAAIVLGDKTIVAVTGEYTFTFACLSAGGASGTLTFGPGVGSTALLTAAGNIQSATSGTLVGAGVIASQPAAVGETVELAKDDDLALILTGHTDIDAGRRLAIEVDFSHEG